MPRLLDLFSGAGGAGMGYHRAGFDVVGVDIAPQPNYPFEFHRADALAFLAEHGHRYDVIHASPPCQSYSVTQSIHGYEYPDLVAATRAALMATGKPYIIENVPGAPLYNALVLCGSMFGLQMIRHRLFECSPVIWFAPAGCTCRAMYTNSSSAYSAFANGATAITMAGQNFRREDAVVASGIDWMQNRHEMAQAIPPAYTEWIGRQMKEAPHA